MHSVRAGSGGLKIAEAGLALVAAGGVLAFGGVQPLTYSLMEIAAALLAVAVFWRAEGLNLSKPALAILGILLALPLVQCVSLPRFLVSLISPARVALAEKLLTPFIGPPGMLPLSVNPWATLVAFLKTAGYVLAFVMGYHIYQRRAGSTLLIPALMTIGVFEAAYGMVQYLTGWQYIFSYAKKVNTEVATGTYINPNNYAGLLGMVLPFALAIILFRFPGREASTRGTWRRFVAFQLPGPWMAQVVLFTILFLGVVFSRSRMGLMSALCGLLVVVALAAFGSGRRSGLALPLLILGIPLAYAAWIGLTPVLYRFELLAVPEYLEAELRPKMWRETLHLIRDFPVCGTGLGTYRWAIPHYQSETVLQPLDFAHNDYLQFAAEIGIPAALLAFGALWVLVARVAVRSRTMERTRDKVLAAGCAGALVPLLVHSMAEFNFQIPANAFVYAWIAGTAAAISRGLPAASVRTGIHEVRFAAEGNANERT